jgi:hypothetical protein
MRKTKSKQKPKKKRGVEKEVEVVEAGEEEDNTIEEVNNNDEEVEEEEEEEVVAVSYHTQSRNMVFAYLYPTRTSMSIKAKELLANVLRKKTPRVTSLLSSVRPSRSASRQELALSW